MDMIYDFMTIVTNKIDFPSQFFVNSICCGEPLAKMVEYNILTANCACNDFYFDTSEMQNKQHIADFFKVNDSLPVLFISSDCFDIPSGIIGDMFRQYRENGDTAFYDKKNIIFAYFVSPEAKRKVLSDFENLNRNIQSGENNTVKKYSADYIVPCTLKELREKGDAIQRGIILAHEDSGIQFTCIESVSISPFAKLYSGVVVQQGTIIRGRSIIGENTILGPNTLIDTSIIGENCIINSTQIYSSIIEDDVRIGPFCHIRPNCHIKSGVRIGDFVEVKNSTVGRDTHASHLTYIGDSDVGDRVNFGCGSVTVNYNGIEKNRCTIGDDVFIGCNTNLIAPINIGEGAYTAAGSTISIDIPPDALAISRAREQKIVDGWVIKHKNMHRKK